MYCFIKYTDPLPDSIKCEHLERSTSRIDYSNAQANKSNKDLSEEQKLLQSASLSRSKTTVDEQSSHGSSITSTNKRNKVLMVNPDCYVQILVDYLYQEIGLSVKSILILPNEKHPCKYPYVLKELMVISAKFDLVDENGILMNIYYLKPYESAKTILQHKQTYVVVIYEKDENDCFKRLEPLLYKITKQEADFYFRILKNLKAARKSPESILKEKGNKSASAAGSKKTPRSSSKSSNKKPHNSSNIRVKRTGKSE